jgi:hypothetical protein
LIIRELWQTTKWFFETYLKDIQKLQIAPFELIAVILLKIGKQKL